MSYIFDYSNLIKAVYKKGLTSEDVAKILGITEREYLLKLNNQDEFTQEEIDLLVKHVLNLAPDAIPEYFFQTNK